MRFLTDQNVFATTVEFVGSLGHYVITAAEIGCARASDTELLNVAQQRDCVLITRDRHFGSLVFVNRLGSGVIYLRMLPSNVRDVHDELARVLATHSGEELKRAFVVVESGGHRFRRLPN